MTLFNVQLESELKKQQLYIKRSHFLTTNLTVRSGVTMQAGALVGAVAVMAGAAVLAGFGVALIDVMLTVATGKSRWA